MKRTAFWLLFLFATTLAPGQGAGSPPANETPFPAAQTVPASRSSLGVLSQEQIQLLIRQVAEKDVENDKRQRDYTYVERVEQHKLNGKGDITSTDTRTYDVMQIFNEQCRRLTAKNDQPLSAKDAAKEEEKIQKLIDKRKNESDAQREKRLKEEEKDREETRQFVKEIADAYNFTMVGVESLDGREIGRASCRERVLTGV